MSAPHFGQTGGTILAECGMMPAAFFNTVGAFRAPENQEKPIPKT
jgi:adenine/guanine phosphoribosyltransferase-like PRPP-binding protein